MNVANRKLFANRDARKKLAEMGGILASSPELLGEAMTFANGGEAEVEQYVVIIRGINGGRPIRLRGDTLARLQDLVPEIMQQAFVMDAATAAERGVDVNRLRPGDAFVERQLTPAAPVPTVQEPVDDRSIRDIVREGLASTYDYNPLSGNFTEQSLSELLTTPTNPMVQMVESGLQSLGVEDPNAALIAQVDPSIVAQLSAPPMYDMTKFGRLGDALPDISFRSSDDPTNPMVSLIESGLKSAGVEDPNKPLVGPLDPSLVAQLSAPPMYDMTGFREAFQDVLPNFTNVTMPAPEAFTMDDSTQRITDAALANAALSPVNIPNEEDALLAQAQALLSDEANARINSGNIQATVDNASNLLASEELAAATENDGFVPVILNQGTPSMAVFDFDPATGEIRPRGTNAEIMLIGGANAEANVQKMVIDQYDLEKNIAPRAEAELAADAAQRKFEITGTGEDLAAAAEARRKATDAKNTAMISPPSAVDQVLSRTQTFKDVPYALDEMEEALAALLEQVTVNPKQVSNKIAADLIEKNTVRIMTREDSEVLDLIRQNEDAYRDAAYGTPRTSDKTPSVETKDGKTKTKDGKTPSVEKIIKMTPAEATDEYYKQLKEMFGLSDEDKARDLSLTMAQFGLAMAAGQSPNALTNIANAANATLAQFKAERKEERALDRELMLAADERAREDEKRREDARERLQRAYIGAGLDPVYGEDGSITSFKALPSKQGTYTPERLRQSILEMIKDENAAELFGVLGDDDKIDMDKVNRLIETYQVLGTSLYEGPSTSGTGTSVGTTKTFKQGTFKKIKEGPDDDPNTWEKVE